MESLGNYKALRSPPGCNPMLRMFAGSHAIDRFHRGNLFGVGEQDLIYEGQNPCAEGPWAIIWPDGLHYSYKREPIVLYGEFWRVLPGANLKVVGVMPGCCADPWSYYYLYDPMPRAVCTAAPSALALPDTAHEARTIVVLSHDVALQITPDAAEKHSADEPYQPPRILAGTAAEQLLSATDPEGRVWRLVRVESHLLQYTVGGQLKGPTHLLGWARD
jgi:hypothetical protein